MSPELQAAVDTAYRTFGRYRLKGTVTVCPCCVSEEQARKLSTTPVAEISTELLSEYTHSAHSFDGKVEDDLRYLLPRYLDLIAMGAPPTYIDEEICLQRLQEADWRNAWRQADADAIAGVFLALVKDRLTTPLEFYWNGMPYNDNVEVALCMIAHAGGEMAPLLGAWDADQSRNATLHIANVVAAADWRATWLSNTWWPMHDRAHVEAAMKEVIAWLLREEIRARLEAACLAEADDGSGTLLSQAESAVGRLI